jgi:hypothetical protein
MCLTKIAKIRCNVKKLCTKKAVSLSVTTALNPKTYDYDKNYPIERVKFLNPIPHYYNQTSFQCK